MASVNRWFGLLSYRPRWGLSRRGWLFLCLALISGSLALLLGVHPFLAESHAVATPILVAEGWIPDYALKQTVAEFRRGAYRALYTTGSPFAAEPDTHADVAARRLVNLGLPPDRVHAVVSPSQTRDRTLASAESLRAWLQGNGAYVSAFNVVTLGAHARRTRLLYERAFGPGVRIGVIAVKNEGYDPRRWWRYNEGVREVFGEGLAYLYAKVGL